MAAQPGEEMVATLFGDVHYFYGPPTDKPPHHRFDKNSYVYLFEDANKGRARLEVANNPGTDDQDAFEGYLDATHLRYSYKQTCLVTLTVGDVQGHDEWHLPTYDPHNQNKYHYKLHSLDIYFWAQQDALQFVNGIRRVLPPAQCEVLDEPGPPPRHAATDISPVVQKLEKAAISSDVSARSATGNGAAPAEPPISAVSGSTGPSPPQAFVPMAYNPASPAAPEQIRPREKTPPPEDGGINPLHQTLAHDATTPFSPGLVPSGAGPLSPGIPPPQFQPPPGAPSFPGPPQHTVTSPGLPPQGFGSLGAGAGATQATSPPPQHPGLARAATMPAHGLPSPGLSSPGFASPGALTSPGLASPYGTGSFPQNTPTPPSVAGHPPPPPGPPPPGGFSQYSYGAAATAPGAMDYSIHQQVYRPTETEAAVQYKPKREPTGKLEENGRRLERGMTGMLKKFEKKFG